MAKKRIKYVIGDPMPELADLAMRRAAYAWQCKLRYDQDGQPDTVLAVIDRRTDQFRRFHQDGWKTSRSGKTHYGLCCPPCGVFSWPTGMYQCNMRPCPFCWGRWVGEIYARLVKQRQEFPEADIYSWHHFQSCQALAVYREDFDARDSDQFVTVMRAMDLLRKDFRKQTRKAVGGIHLNYTYPRRFVSQPGDTVRGTWQIQRRAILFWPKEQPLKLPGKVIRWRLPNEHAYASQIGDTLAFPGRWLLSDTKAMAMMLTWLGDKRLLSYFGGMAPAYCGKNKE